MISLILPRIMTFQCSSSLTAIQTEINWPISFSINLAIVYKQQGNNPHPKLTFFINWQTIVQKKNHIFLFIFSPILYQNSKFKRVAITGPQEKKTWKKRWLFLCILLKNFCLGNQICGRQKQNTNKRLQTIYLQFWMKKLTFEELLYTIYK